MTSSQPLTRPIQVAVLAADERVQTSLRHLLMSGDIVVVASCSPRRSAMAAVRADVVVVDLEPRTARTTLEELRALPSRPSAVVLGDDAGSAAGARAAGASYLDKAEVAERLLPCVRAAAGERTPTDR
ncbi:MAG: hypothetical protein ACTHNS_00550 [Marmoricola sp.]